MKKWQNREIHQRTWIYFKKTNESLSTKMDQIDGFNMIDTEEDRLVKSEGRSIENTQTGIQREKNG